MNKHWLSRLKYYVCILFLQLASNVILFKIKQDIVVMTRKYACEWLSLVLKMFKNFCIFEYIKINCLFGRIYDFCCVTMNVCGSHKVHGNFLETYYSGHLIFNWRQLVREKKYFPAIFLVVCS